MTDQSTWTKVPSVTLVLGAGVSMGLVPNWDELTDRVVDTCEGDPSLKSCNRPACKRLPNDNQVRLELAWRGLYKRRLDERLSEKRNSDPPIGQRMLELETDVETEWFTTLRREIYPKGKKGYLGERRDENHSDTRSPSDTLNAIVDLLLNPRLGTRVQRVVTLNADDWLEYALAYSLGSGDPKAGAKDFHKRFRVISQPTHGADSLVQEQNIEDESGALLARIPIIHIHGLLCHPAEDDQSTSSYATPNEQGRRPSYDAPNMLVFRDLDYWRMTSNASSFANHVMLSALSTSRCVFVGLSMRDLNLLRWFGFLAAEHETAWQNRWRLHFDKGIETVKTAGGWACKPHLHQWLTESCDSVLKEMLTYRGIQQVETDWSLPTGPKSLSENLRNALEYKSSRKVASAKSAAPKKQAAKKNKPVNPKRR